MLEGLFDELMLGDVREEDGGKMEAVRDEGRRLKDVGSLGDE